jgi:hypothetical protein
VSACVAANLPLRLRDVTFDLLDIGASNSADETAAGVVHLHDRNGVDVVLFRAPIGEVNLAQCNLAIACRHLLQGRRNYSAWGAPVCMEIDQRHLAGHGLSRLPATGHCKWRKTQN